jgi:sulfite reductase (NADPH) flavoprotein alpha-component
MSVAPRPPIPQLIPESAPFSPEQRTWLNGFFSGLISFEGSTVTPLSSAESAALMPAPPGVAVAAEDDDDAPWHDQTILLNERMKLAEGRPLRRRMMAAMAQQDCGQCGYNCQDYSNAIFARKEERLNLCVPGGKETARMLKTLFEEFGNSSPSTMKSSTTPAAAASVAPAPSAAPGHSRDNPVEATFLSRKRLN